MNKSEKLNRLMRSGQLVLVEFYADWCSHCKLMEPVMQTVKKDMEGKVNLICVDIEKNESLAQFYTIEVTPTFILMKDHESLWRQSGEMSIERLEKAVRGVE